MQPSRTRPSQLCPHVGGTLHPMAKNERRNKSRARSRGTHHNILTGSETVVRGLRAFVDVTPVQEQPFDMWIFDIARTQSEETRQMRLQQIVHAYDECFTQRVRANDICGEMRGTVDKGHRDAPFTRCRDRKDAVLARFLV
ncbi:hypothetical protein PMIN07_012613 [Paraphaeosphaeria minitans]